MFFWKKKEEKIDFNRKFGSFAFYFSIPSALILSSILLVSTLNTLKQTGFQSAIWVLLSHAFISAWALFGGKRETRTKTLIHELKHAALVIITGNKLKEIKVGRTEGHVAYNVNEDTLHLEPFVLLAPYFFPLFSLPVFLCAVFLGEGNHLPFVWALGFALGIDLTTAANEVHGHQSDLRRIFGGFLATRSFIFGANLLWASLCLLWISGASKGFEEFGLVLGRIADQFLLTGGHEKL